MKSVWINGLQRWHAMRAERHLSIGHLLVITAIEGAGCSVPKPGAEQPSDEHRSSSFQAQQQRHNQSIQEGDLRPSVMASATPVVQDTGANRCQADGCMADLSGLRRYFRRYHVCETHIRSQVVHIGGREVRFCDQCSTFHPLAFFDGVRRTCRDKLEQNRMKRRARKQQNANHAGAITAAALAGAAAAASGNNNGGGGRSDDVDSDDQPANGGGPAAAAGGDDAGPAVRAQGGHSLARKRQSGTLAQGARRLQPSARSVAAPDVTKAVKVQRATTGQLGAARAEVWSPESADEEPDMQTPGPGDAGGGHHEDADWGAADMMTREAEMGLGGALGATLAAADGRDTGFGPAAATATATAKRGRPWDPVGLAPDWPRVNHQDLRDQEQLQVAYGAVRDGAMYSPRGQLHGHLGQQGPQVQVQVRAQTVKVQPLQLVPPLSQHQQQHQHQQHQQHQQRLPMSEWEMETGGVIALERLPQGAVQGTWRLHGGSAPNLPQDSHALPDKSMHDGGMRLAAVGGPTNNGGYQVHVRTPHAANGAGYPAPNTLGDPGCARDGRVGLPSRVADQLITYKVDGEGAPAVTLLAQILRTEPEFRQQLPRTSQAGPEPMSPPKITLHNGGGSGSADMLAGAAEGLTPAQQAALRLKLDAGLLASPPNATTAAPQPQPPSSVSASAVPGPNMPKQWAQVQDDAPLQQQRHHHQPLVRHELPGYGTSRPGGQAATVWAGNGAAPQGSVWVTPDGTRFGAPLAAYPAPVGLGPQAVLIDRRISAGSSVYTADEEAALAMEDVTSLQMEAERAAIGTHNDALQQPIEEAPSLLDTPSFRDGIARDNADAQMWEARRELQKQQQQVQIVNVFGKLCDEQRPVYLPSAFRMHVPEDLDADSDYLQPQPQHAGIAAGARASGRGPVAAVGRPAPLGGIGGGGGQRPPSPAPPQPHSWAGASSGWRYSNGDSGGAPAMLEAQPQQQSASAIGYGTQQHMQQLGDSLAGVAPSDQELILSTLRKFAAHPPRAVKTAGGAHQQQQQQPDSMGLSPSMPQGRGPQDRGGDSGSGGSSGCGGTLHMLRAEEGRATQQQSYMQQQQQRQPPPPQQQPQQPAHNAAAGGEQLNLRRESSYNDNINGGPGSAEGLQQVLASEGLQSMDSLAISEALLDGRGSLQLLDSVVFAQAQDAWVNTDTNPAAASGADCGPAAMQGGPPTPPPHGSDGFTFGQGGRVAGEGERWMGSTSDSQVHARSWQQQGAAAGEGFSGEEWVELPGGGPGMRVWERHQEQQHRHVQQHERGPSHGGMFPATERRPQHQQQQQQQQGYRPQSWNERHHHHHHQQQQQQQQEGLRDGCRPGHALYTSPYDINRPLFGGRVTAEGSGGGGGGQTLSHVALKLSHARPDSLPMELVERMQEAARGGGAAVLPATLREGCVEVLVEVMHSCPTSQLCNKLFGFPEASGGASSALDLELDSALATASGEQLRAWVGPHVFDSCERVTMQLLRGPVLDCKPGAPPKLRRWEAAMQDAGLGFAAHWPEVLMLCSGPPVLVADAVNAQQIQLYGPAELASPQGVVQLCVRMAGGAGSLGTVEAVAVDPEDGSSAPIPADQASTAAPAAVAEGWLQPTTSTTSCWAAARRSPSPPVWPLAGPLSGLKAPVPGATSPALFRTVNASAGATNRLADLVAMAPRPTEQLKASPSLATGPCPFYCFAVEEVSEAEGPSSLGMSSRELCVRKGTPPAAGSAPGCTKGTVSETTEHPRSCFLTAPLPSSLPPSPPVAQQRQHRHQPGCLYNTIATAAATVARQPFSQLLLQQREQPRQQLQLCCRPPTFHCRSKSDDGCMTLCGSNDSGGRHAGSPSPRVPALASKGESLGRHSTPSAASHVCAGQPYGGGGAPLVSVTSATTGLVHCLGPLSRRVSLCSSATLTTAMTLHDRLSCRSSATTAFTLGTTATLYDRLSLRSEWSWTSNMTSFGGMTAGAACGGGGINDGGVGGAAPYSRTNEPQVSEPTYSVGASFGCTDQSLGPAHCARTARDDSKLEEENELMVSTPRRVAGPPASCSSPRAVTAASVAAQPYSSNSSDDASRSGGCCLRTGRLLDSAMVGLRPLRLQLPVLPCAGLALLEATGGHAVAASWPLLVVETVSQRNELLALWRELADAGREDVWRELAADLGLVLGNLPRRASVCDEPDPYLRSVPAAAAADRAFSSSALGSGEDFGFGGHGASAAVAPLRWRSLGTPDRARDLLPGCYLNSGSLVSIESASQESWGTASATPRLATAGQAVNTGPVSCMATLVHQRSSSSSDGDGSGSDVSRVGLPGSATSGASGDSGTSAVCVADQHTGAGLVAAATAAAGVGAVYLAAGAPARSRDGPDAATVDGSHAVRGAGAAAGAPVSAFSSHMATTSFGVGVVGVGGVEEAQEEGEGKGEQLQLPAVGRTCMLQRGDEVSLASGLAVIRGGCCDCDGEDDLHIASLTSFLGDLRMTAGRRESSSDGRGRDDDAAARREGPGLGDGRRSNSSSQESASVLAAVESGTRAETGDVAVGKGEQRKIGTAPKEVPGPPGLALPSPSPSLPVPPLAAVGLSAEARLALQAAVSRVRRCIDARRLPALWELLSRVAVDARTGGNTEEEESTSEFSHMTIMLTVVLLLEWGGRARPGRPAEFEGRLEWAERERTLAARS
ncbi:hypothetical protein VOLCADRAFT_93794 [Volvox carteri f. nagariensis]|uniref:SBP-type domain-containing protein n=1 Tax=Volvox carteri f. nagariensis TaxID=3068 RepID=D8U329_VOLCA|nr:uncharacterized protein VOLCADRAFT_93794 [Volvox carteri f. nagariensis]EFJ45908.1 hypothetical protein VOLCADRAFT_93794 [Volvox carteri f. nagariensis]|eukprot:XP_002952986.1 hypothetical protein VOLCADRAFT_93794 [Volvox carteri f. nagariensis]